MKNRTSKVGIKIASGQEMSQSIRISRKYCDLPINQIKDCILNNKYVFEGSYINEEDIILIIKMYNELCENRIRAELFEHDRKANIEFFKNLVKMYHDIGTEISDRIDEEADDIENII